MSVSCQPKRLSRVILAAVALLCASTLLGVAAPAPAAAASCSSIRLGGEDFVFYKQGIGCDKAQRNLRHVRRTNGAWEPRGWDCETGQSWKRGGNCWKRGDESRIFGFHAYD